MLPVSPMKMEAGLKLYGTNASTAPSSASASTIRSPLPLHIGRAGDHRHVDGEKQEPVADDAGDAAGQPVQAIHQVDRVAAEDDERDRERQPVTEETASGNAKPMSLLS